MELKRDELGGYLARSAVIFAAYFVTARIGLELNAVSGFATLVWAPTGIALAAIILLGRKYWPVIFLAAFTTNLSMGAAAPVALGIGIGNTAEALLGAYLLARFTDFQPSLERVRDIRNFVILAALCSTAVSATVGVTCLLIGSVTSSGAAGRTWIAWWIGDVLGALVVAPLLLVWSRARPVGLRRKQVVEASLYVLLLIAICALTFRGAIALGKSPSIVAFIIFPMLMWIALRFGQIGSVSATFVMAAIAIWRTIAAFNHSNVSGNLSQHLLPLQALVGVIAITFMVLAAVNAERERAQKLQMELAVRNARLTEQSARLKSLNKAKDEFIAIASHQLRTPASSVKQYVGMLVDGYAGKLSPSQKKLAAKAYGSNDRQLQIIGQLLRVARIDSGQLRLDKSRIDFVGLINDVLVSCLTDTVANRNQTINFSSSRKKMLASIDEGKVRMAIENILDNASKYSPSGSKIEVTLTANSPDIVLRIKDYGVGIAKQDLPKLFKKFSRIDNELSTTVGGTGLGLYWAKKVINLHHGTIGVVSEPNEGTTFTIKLPASA